MSEKIDEILSSLGPAYDGWKSNEKDKERYKKEFFEAITEHLQNGSSDKPAQKVVEETAKTEAEAREKIEKRYPMWTLEEIRPIPDTSAFEAIISERPEYMPFSYEHDGRVFQRQVVSGSVYIDDDRLKDESPSLWEDVTEIPNYNFLRYMADEIGDYEGMGGVNDAIQTLADKWGLERQLRPLDDLTPIQLACLQEYMYEGKPTVKFPAPKKAESA